MKALVVGYGSIGQRHMKNLLTLNAGEVFAFDILEDRRREAKEQLGIEVVECLDEAWEREPNVAFITASTQQHMLLALQAAEHGCHLFIEKPLAHTLDGVEQLISQVKHRGLATMVGCNMRFHPGPVTVKRLLEEGAIGTIIGARIQIGSYLPRWRLSQDYRQSYSASPEWGGAILDCIHEIDLALWYLGRATLFAAAHVPARTIGLQTEGLAEIILQHESGALTSIHLNFVQRDYRRVRPVSNDLGIYFFSLTFADQKRFNSRYVTIGYFPDPVHEVFRAYSLRRYSLFF